MSPSSRQRTVELRDGARVILRPIAPGDKLLLVDAFERLSDDSRYRRFFTSLTELSPAHLEYLTEVDHRDHEAIIALEASTGVALGVARYVRSATGSDDAEAAVTVVDDWHGRGLARALLQRLATRARREGVTRFTALVQSDNASVVGLLESLGPSTRSREGTEMQLVIELPKRGIGAQLTRTLRAAATGSIAAVDTVAHRFAESARPAPELPPLKVGRRLLTIVVGNDGSPAGEQALAAAVELAVRAGANLHVVSAYRIGAQRPEAQAILTRARRVARAAGRRPQTHALREHPVEALIAVAESHDADLIVVGGKGVTAAARLLLGSVADQVARHAPCNVLIVR